MAMPARAVLCGESKKLAADLFAAVNAVVVLQDQRRASIESGGTDLVRIEGELTSARQQWEQAQSAYESHAKQHGC